jgi:hypothetical protein
LVFAAIGVAGVGRGFATEFSVALGFVGLTLMGLEFLCTCHSESSVSVAGRS